MTRADTRAHHRNRVALRAILVNCTSPPNGKRAMLGVRYFKAQPTDHVVRYRSGKIVKRGRGLAFFYLNFNTRILAIPTTGVDSPFVFNEVADDFQTVAIQGQLTYRVAEPDRAAEILNFAYDPVRERHLTDDPDKLSQRVVNVVRVQTRARVAKLALRDILRAYPEIARQIHDDPQTRKLLEPLGVELLSVYFLAAAPTPEVAKALEAEYRESLLRQADEAIYARRAAAIAEERKIQENELDNQIAVERRRRELVELEGENQRAEAENRGKARETEAAYQARAEELRLAPFRATEPRLLLALAMHQLGENADRVGNLTITSEILATLLDASKSKSQS